MTKVELDEVLVSLSVRQLSDELERRANANDEVAAAELRSLAADWVDIEGGPFYLESDPDPLFEKMSDWERAELERAVRLDDGRRVIDVLRAHIQ